jgi:hypothetical protein
MSEKQGNVDVDSFSAHLMRNVIWTQFLWHKFNTYGQFCHFPSKKGKISWEEMMMLEERMIRNDEITYRCCIFVFKSCVKITFIFFKYKNMNLKKRGNHTLQISENYNSRLMTKIKIFYYNAGGLANFISQVGYYYKKHNS